MYAKVSLNDFYTQADRQVAHIRSATGFGQLSFEVAPNCGRGSLIRLRNAVHYGFELSQADLLPLQRSYLPSPVQARHLPLWEHLHGTLVDIWTHQGYGSLELEFQPMKRDRGTVVFLRGGPCYRIQLPNF